MKSDFVMAVTQLAAERNLPKETVVAAVEAALVSAYKKDTGAVNQNIEVRLNPNEGEVQIFLLKEVVEEVTEPELEVTVKEAKKLQPGREYAIGDVLEFELPAQVTGRIAAQTAKQVVIQRLREAERELVFEEFADREGEVFTATVQRSDSRYGGVVTLDLNARAEAVLPSSEQVPYERYRPGLRMKVMILEVVRTNRGPEIVVSRTHPDLLRRVFEMEVPEIFNGIVEIKSVAREPGSRSKVAVAAKQEGVDPVGACVGLRGIRIQNIVNELQGEKIDVIQWSRDPAVFLTHALSPAQPLRVDMDEEAETAMVMVPDRQLSLAIGREGQNARLAAKLTGWKVDIKSSTEVEIERMKQAIDSQVAEQAAIAESSASAASVETTEVEEPVTEVAATPEPVETVVAEAVVVEEAEVEVLGEAQEEISPEEMLALESLEITPAARQNRVVEAPKVEELVDEEEEDEDEVIVEDEVWKMPEPIGGGPQIRFAEDILGATGPRGAGRGRRRRSRPAGGSRGFARPGGGTRTGGVTGRPGGATGGRTGGTGAARPPRRDSPPTYTPGESDD